jgi:hypothetical protein
LHGPAAMRRLGLVLVAGLVCPALARADGELPAMKHDKGVVCLEDGEGRRWRVQCDDAARVCLYSPDSELDADGKWRRPLERAPTCFSSGIFDKPGMEAKGYRVVRAIADAPYGWMRDERGRVFQVNFDLHRRLYVGGSWAPIRAPEGNDATRVAVEFGLLVFDHWEPGGSTRHRLRLVEGETRVAPFSADVVLAHWDLSHRYDNPLVRVTTFFGRPRRHDLLVNVGAWAEAGGFEIHEAPGGDETLWRFATVNGTIDLWQSRDLDSYVRLRGGAGLERTYVTREAGVDRSAFTPGGAVETDVTIDREGFHHVTGEVGVELPRIYDGETEVGKRARRFKTEVGYEAILIALNDQPITVRLAAGASRRDDIPGLPERWAFTANAGLRFSLWAPARRP